jgi:hypothetical protein
MKPSEVRIATWLYVIGFALTGLMLCIPPACLPLYLGLGVVGFVPLRWGTGWYRKFGRFAVTVALIAAGWEVFGGIQHHKEMLRLHERIKQLRSTNSVPQSPKQ